MLGCCKGVKPPAGLLLAGHSLHHVPPCTKRMFDGLDRQVDESDKAGLCTAEVRVWGSIPNLCHLLPVNPLRLARWQCGMQEHRIACVNS